MTQIDKLEDAPLPKWTYNANRTHAALTAYGADCQAWRGCRGEWLFRVESLSGWTYEDSAMTRGEAFKQAIRVAIDAAREVQGSDALQEVA